MKQLTRIRLVNWHLFTDVTITCQGTTYFIGVNGAGKSTILDAVQFALVGGQRDVKFNQAAMVGSRRTLSSYVRGELGTEGQRYLRGDCTGLVALEFANPADLDYGGLNILAQLRKLVSPRFTPYRMDVATLDAHIRWARPLTENDRRLLARIRGYASLADVRPVIGHMLERGLKLEQEAVRLAAGA